MPVLPQLIVALVKFQFPNESALEWSSSSAVPNSRFILYLKVGKLISNG